MPTQSKRRVRQPLRKPCSPQVMARARRLYETTRTPVTEICALLGVGIVTFYRRVKRWGWTRRWDNPRLQPPFSRSRSRRAVYPRLSGDTPDERPEIPLPCGLCDGLRLCAARRAAIAQLDAVAMRHAAFVTTVHKSFNRQRGRQLVREEEGFAHMMAGLASSRNALAEIGR